MKTILMTTTLSLLFISCSNLEKDELASRYKACLETKKSEKECEEYKSRKPARTYNPAFDSGTTSVGREF